jgi:hypothetical protein
MIHDYPTNAYKSKNILFIFILKKLKRKGKEKTKLKEKPIHGKKYHYCVVLKKIIDAYWRKNMSQV